MIATLSRQSRVLLEECERAGRDCVIVAVERVEGSAPRERGAAMLVTAAAAGGTIGGGHLELRSLVIARELLLQPASSLRVGASRRFPLGPALGQCCGGVVHVSFHFCPSGKVPAALDVRATAPLFHLHLFGAGHVGQALVDVLSVVECEVAWVDSREQQFPARLPANVTIEFSEAPEEEVSAAPPGAFYLVMTHSHALDLAIVERILKRGDAGFIGLIGSKTKRATFERRLLERGIERALLTQIMCPIGAPGVVGKAPGVVAIAVAAQLMQIACTRSGPTGSRVREICAD